MKSATCIIAAAGASIRMNKWKPGLGWGSQTIIESVIDSAVSSGCEVLVVGGNRYNELAGILRGKTSVRLLEAENWEKGMAETIKTALVNMNGEDFFVVPGDMPFIRTDDYYRLMTLCRGEIIRPEYQGKPGHPVLFPGRYAQMVLSSRKSFTMKHIIRAWKVDSVGWDHEGVIIDIDTPEEYVRFSPDDQLGK